MESFWRWKKGEKSRNNYTYIHHWRKVKMNEWIWLLAEENI
jgi:hypothetical protein